MMAWTCKLIAVLMAVWLLVLPVWVAAQHTMPPSWVVDAAVPGPNLPPVGRSLFDELLGASATRVPFPFSALLNRIRARLQLSVTAPEPFAAVLIPLGRSLQRHAAAPDYFRYPRVVVAVVGESGAGDAPLLKDRLYLGYQERAGVLEVISYNEAMGRFEFQVMKDYRPGGTPRLYYAKRSLCTACHQNQAPIFSRPLWRETNANPAIAARLLAQKRDFYGIPVQRGVDIPEAIDAATQRANLYAAYQLLWSEGCGAAVSERQARQCRASLFSAVLQLRLSAWLGFTRDDVTALRQRWQQHWPHGLALANPEIPNRDPLDLVGGAATPREVIVPARFDPLLPRPALETWTFDRDSAVERGIDGLADFIAQADIRRLDAVLYQRGRRAPRRSYQAACQFIRTPTTAGRWRLDVHCPAARSDTTELALDGRLYFEGRRLRRGVFDSLRIQQDTLDNISVTSTESAAAKSPVMNLQMRRGALHARRRNGNALAVAQLRWHESATPAATFTGNVVIEEQQDYAPVDAALRRLTTADVFAAQPLRRAELVSALFTQLGISAPPICCRADTALPPPRLERSVSLDVAAYPALAPAQATGLRTLQRYCAPCHDSAERFPPNFLSGDLATVQAKLAHCAERIDYRLSLWDSAPDARTQTPMPPALALRAYQHRPVPWPTDPDFIQLRQFVRGLRTTSPVSADHVNYEQLAVCLPEGG